MTFDDNEFLTSFKNIYSKELDLKVERQENHVSYLDLDRKVEESVFVYKPFDKRDKFSNTPFVKQYAIYNFLWIYIFRTFLNSKMPSKNI